MVGGESKGLRRYDKENLLWQSTVAIKSDPVGSGDIPKSAMGMSWRESRSGAGHELVSGAAAATRGHDVVMTPCSYCYLDYGQGLGDDPFLYIGGKLTALR